jgi:hypothetical protein
MKQALPFVGAFLAFFIIGGIALYVMSDPLLSRLDWGAIGLVSFCIGLVILAVANFGGKKVLFGTLAVIALILGTVAVSSLQSGVRVNEQEQILQAQLEAEAAAIEQQIEANTPPGYVRVYKPYDLTVPFIWGLVFIAVCLTGSYFFRSIPKILWILGGTGLHAAFVGEFPTWGSALLIMVIMTHVVKFLLNIFDIAVALVANFISVGVATVVAAVFAAFIYMTGGTQVWTVMLLMPSNPAGWVVLGSAVATSLIILGYWDSPPV